MPHNISHASTLGWTLLLVALSIGVYALSSFGMFASTWIIPIFGALAANSDVQNTSDSSASAAWAAPSQTRINNLSAVYNTAGVYGFIFNSSYATSGNDYYGGYNWCNMPHVNTRTYVKAPEEYALEYVEVVRPAEPESRSPANAPQIHRHHKRTPYASNVFPRESYSWDCDDEGLFCYGKSLNPPGNNSASTYWSLYTSPSNPFHAEGFNGTCQFPQITRGGLDDSHQHGKDLYAVYHDQLGFLPDTPSDKVTFRVTNNVITSQVAGMVVKAMYPQSVDFPVHIQPATIDSLEPAYACPLAASIYSTYGIGSTSTNWTAHLTASSSLFTFLDSLSEINPNDAGWHQSWDHYFDNLSSRLCHAKPLPCQISNIKNCINQTVAESVLRLGLYEYSYIYRDAPQFLQASVAAYGVYVAELAQNIRDAISGANPVRYRHNVAHDGSLSKLLSILQVDVMVWPGMGAEIVFEVFKKDSGERFVRILWGGVVLRSSNPTLGIIDLIPVDTLLGYFDELVGIKAAKVPGLCTVT